MANTANYGWLKPTVGGDTNAWGGEINTDLDAIDAQVYNNAQMVPVVAAATPLMDGSAAVGTSTKYAREDHVHPIDTSRYAASNPSGFQTASQVTTALGSYYLASNPSGYQTSGQVATAISAAAYSLPTATTSVLGGVKVDGSTITISGGVITAAAGVGTYLPLTGGTLSGALNVNATVTIGGGGGTLNLNSSGTNIISSLRSSASRWDINLASGSETGSNAGSNLKIIAWNDANSSSVTPLSIVRATGVATFSAAIVQPSDRRLKENIEPIANALDLVNAMSGSYYNRIGFKAREIGLIAQDVAMVIPEVVHRTDDGMMALEYGKLVAVLVNAVKELTARVAELEAR